MTGTGAPWGARLRWGIATMVLMGMVPALAGGGRIHARKVGVIPWQNDFCVMEGAIYLYDGEDQTLVRYRVGKDALSGPERPIGRLPCAPWVLGCGQERIVGWCGDPRVERDGFEWNPETGKVREFDWPWLQVVGLQVVPGGLLVLTKERLYRWEIGEVPGEANVLYEAGEEEQFLRLMADQTGSRVAVLEYAMRGLMAGRHEDFVYVVAMKVTGGGAKVVGRYRVKGSPVALTGEVLWGSNVKPWERMESWKGIVVRSGPENPVGRRQAPWGLLAEDWRTGKVLASWGEDLRIKARSDGERAIALVTPLLKRDPVEVYELTFEIEQEDDRERIEGHNRGR